MFDGTVPEILQLHNELMCVLIICSTVDAAYTTTMNSNTCCIQPSVLLSNVVAFVL